MKRGTATPPPTLGEGCLQRYDPDALSETDGTEFPDAAELWQRLQQASEGEEELAQEIPAPD
jgi:hypothetical protein